VSLHAWSNVSAKAYVEIKIRMASVPVMCLPDFSKIFKVTCDASGIRIGGVLAQEGHPIADFSKKQNDTKQKCSTYDKELYVVIQALRYWRHYLLQ